MNQGFSRAATLQLATSVPAVIKTQTKKIPLKAGLIYYFFTVVIYSYICAPLA
jgi:hypothetical protein